MASNPEGILFPKLDAMFEKGVFDATESLLFDLSAVEMKVVDVVTGEKDLTTWRSDRDKATSFKTFFLRHRIERDAFDHFLSFVQVVCLCDLHISICTNSDPKKRTMHVTAQRDGLRIRSVTATYQRNANCNTVRVTKEGLRYIGTASGLSMALFSSLRRLVVLLNEAGYSNPLK